MVTTTDLRAAVIHEARTWLGTPYRFAARQKGVGVDCHQLFVAVYENAGLSTDLQIPPWRSWHEAALYMRREDLAAYPYDAMRQIDSPEPGDIALFEFHKSYLHLAIVVEWPMVIHALRVVSLCDVSQGVFAQRAVKFLTPKEWK